jgi:hypothetical protein
MADAAPGRVDNIQGGGHGRTTGPFHDDDAVVREGGRGKRQALRWWMTSGTHWSAAPAQGELAAVRRRTSWAAVGLKARAG